MEMYNEIDNVSTKTTGAFLSLALKKGQFKNMFKMKKKVISYPIHTRSKRRDLL